MKCPKCVEAGLRSTVYAPSGGVSTCMAFSPHYGEDGVYHNHDGNIHHETWSCSNGHRWHRSYQDGCPAPNCDWNETRKNSIWFEEPKEAPLARASMQGTGGTHD